MQNIVGTQPLDVVVVDDEVVFVWFCELHGLAESNHSDSWIPTHSGRLPLLCLASVHIALHLSFAPD